MLYIISRTIFEIFIKLLFRLRMHGRENLPEPPYIIASNHASLIDPPLVGLACRKHMVNFMAKKELFSSRFGRWWSTRVGCIEVKRGEVSVGTLKEAVKRLKSGSVVGIFPEGTRSEDGRLQEAKRGTGFLVDKAGVPVVPFYIEGSGRALSKGKPIKYCTMINVYVGKPIMPGELLFETPSGKRDYVAVSNRIMERISELKTRAEKGLEQ